MLNIYVFFWIGLTFFTFLVTMRHIKGHKSVLASGHVPEVIGNHKLDIKSSFYRTDATWHDIIFFHASASGVAIVLLVLIIKGKALFPGTVTFFGVFSDAAILVISMILLLLAFYFYTISIVKLGNTLAHIQISGREIATKYAIMGIFGYFLVFAILALILV